MPLTETLPSSAKPRVGRAADPCVMVIFWCYRRPHPAGNSSPPCTTLPASNCWSREFAVVGIGRTPMTTEEARQKTFRGIQAVRDRPRGPRFMGVVRASPATTFPEILMIPQPTNG